MRKTLLALLATAFIAAAALVPSALADGVQPPARFFQKSLRLEVNLEDVQGLVFDSSLYQVPIGVSQASKAYLVDQLSDGNFDIDARGARCVFVQDGHSQNAPCAQLADMVDSSADGGVYAVLQGTPLASDPLSFRAKKLTVWLDTAGSDTTVPADDSNAYNDSGSATSQAAPPRFYSKSYRLNLNLEDSDGLVFDAALNEIPGTVPAAVRDYLHGVLDGATFEVDANKAACFEVHADTTKKVTCQQLADDLDQTADGGIDAIVLAKPVAGDPLSFQAKKITAWL